MRCLDKILESDEQVRSMFQEFAAPGWRKWFVRNREVFIESGILQAVTVQKSKRNFGNEWLSFDDVLTGVEFVGTKIDVDNVAAGACDGRFVLAFLVAAIFNFLVVESGSAIVAGHFTECKTRTADQNDQRQETCQHNAQYLLHMEQK
ncbi:MAG: hypothetical protein FD123_1080 [Bacteroidetes bacterium]|nr:MAG: hypothetical protein FD123_1080 [Bacteroidota bacterium]